MGKAGDGALVSAEGYTQYEGCECGRVVICNMKGVSVVG